MITINPQAADVITININDADQIQLNTTAIVIASDGDADTLQGEDGAYYLDRDNHTGTQAANTITGLATVATSGSYNDLSDKPTISTNAETLNGQDGAYYLSRANHTGSDQISDVTGLQAALDDKLESVAWGDITGTLSNQTELQDTLDLKLDAADYNDRFLGLFSSVFDLEAAHPTASAGDYAQVDFGIGTNVIIYVYDVSDAQWSAVGSSAIANTNALPEGSSNLYHTSQRVRDTPLTGLSTASATPITAADTVLSAAGKLQAQISASGGEILPIIGGTRWYYSDTLFFDTNYPRSGGVSTTIALNPSMIYFFPRVILEDCEITGVACQTTAGTGAIAAAIYSSDSNGNPANLLASAAGVSASSAGIKTFLISLTLARGQLVYDAILITAASVVVSSNAPARGFGRNSFATGSNFCGFSRSATAFPATAASSPTSFNTMPITGIRVSA